MRLVRYNPLNEQAFWGNSFNDFLNNTRVKTKTDESWHPVVDIINEKDDVVLKVELPGVKKEDIVINIKDRVLTVKGERKFENNEKKNDYYRKERSYGKFQRSFSLSDDILTEDVIADLEDGILKLTLKKDTTKEEIKQITIN